jgi:hypothetical protein
MLRPCCMTCESPRIIRKADLTWDNVKQDWVVSGLTKTIECKNCKDKSGNIYWEKVKEVE